MAYSASEVIAASIYIDKLYFPAQMAKSQARALTTSTGTAVCLIKKNGAQIATMTFSAGNATPAFANMASAVTVSAGDYITIEAPASPDATLYGVIVTLFSERYT